MHELTSEKGGRPHAITLFSGGLDSALAVLLLLKQNIEVTALTFMTSFGCDLSDRSSCGHNPFPAAERFGFRVKLMNLGQNYIDLVRNPRYGYGKNMNPCVDCRIMMLTQAKAYMEMSGADFVATGEVMGQRPFSQVKNKLSLTEQEAGLNGLLLRPLSAKLLPPSIPEQRGWIDREQLMAIEGRSRKPQIELARELGLDDYPNPASGCLLTDPGYSARLKDLFTYSEYATLTDLNLLRMGRQFRVSKHAKVVIGRDEADNERICAQLRDDDMVLEVMDAGSPITMLRGNASEEDVQLAARLTARYSDRRNEPLVGVELRKNGSTDAITVIPATRGLCDRYRITSKADMQALSHSAE
jgi:tRNA U34 2-thiouridine synthase MnmA/TrmU